MKKFVEDVIKSYDDDRDKIRVAPLMYISRVGSGGAVHLCKEIINNSIDELINPHSVGNKIELEYHMKNNMFICKDDGRGFPFNGMEKACCQIQAGSKFNRESGGSTAGQNGAGLTACNALSKYFSIETFKLGEYAKIEFEDGVKTSDPKVKKYKDNKKHGSVVKFSPNEKYMGKCTIDIQDLMKWLGLIQHKLDKKIIINLVIYDENDKKIQKEVFKRKNGLRDLLTEIETSETTKIVDGGKDMQFKERIRVLEDNGKMKEKDVDRHLKVEFAFLLSPSLPQPMTISLCNYVHTIDGGHHIDAIRNAICYYLSALTKASMSDKEKEKYDITFSDITSSLYLVGSVLTDIDPGFTGQTKEKVEKPGLVKPIQHLVKESLVEYFKKNPQIEKKFITIIKTNAKGRFEANKVKNAVVKREFGSISEHSIPKYTPANNKDKNAYRELYIIEGGSVKGNMDIARNKDVQALFEIRGYTFETFTKKVYEVLKNNEFKNLVRATNCGIGEQTNPKHCRFKKIILCPDADSDGHFIFSLLCAFFIKHMQPLVEAGMIYKSCPPLYKIQDKKSPFILNREQYIKVFERRIGDNVKLVMDHDRVLSKDKFYEFLVLNRNYLDELIRLSNHFAVHMLLIEFILFNLGDKNFEHKLSERFPEIEVEDVNKNTKLVTGIIEGKYQMLYIDKIFYKKCNKLLDLINENEYKYYTVLENYNGIYNEIGKLSIGEFFQRVQKYQPKIEMRYKGLGELSSDDLYETTMNPNNRILIQLTVKDMEEELKQFEILHGNADEERKAMVAKFKLDREYLDN